MLGITELEGKGSIHLFVHLDCDLHWEFTLGKTVNMAQFLALGQWPKVDVWWAERHIFYFKQSMICVP